MEMMVCSFNIHFTHNDPKNYLLPFNSSNNSNYKRTTATEEEKDRKQKRNKYDQFTWQIEKAADAVYYNKQAVGVIGVRVCACVRMFIIAFSLISQVLDEICLSFGLYRTFFYLLQVHTLFLRLICVCT